MSIAPKRLLAELRRSCKYAREHFDTEASLDNPVQITESIWIYAKPDNVTSMTALVIGPEDTPYENGFFLFSIDVPSDYPNVPPKVKLLTRDGTVHFNPNLYKNGKVCLSTLGTWSGPGWTCAMTISSLCVDIQSLLVPDPLTNEPSYEVKRPNRLYRYERYSQMIEHATIRVGVWEMLHRTPAGCEVFLPVMQKQFAKHATSMIKRVDALQQKHDKPTTLRCDMWYNFSETLDYAHWANALRDLRDQLCGACGVLSSEEPPTQHSPENHQHHTDSSATVPETSLAADNMSTSVSTSADVDTTAAAVSALHLQSSTATAQSDTQPSTLPEGPPAKKRKYIRRPQKKDMIGKKCGDTIQILQKDSGPIVFVLKAGIKDPNIMRWYKTKPKPTGSTATETATETATATAQ